MKRILSILSVATLFVLIGCTDSNDDMEIVYDSIIEPDFTVAAAEIVAGVTPVTFTNTTSVEGTTVAEYFWHFGFGRRQLVGRGRTRSDRLQSGGRIHGDAHGVGRRRQPRDREKGRHRAGRQRRADGRFQLFADDGQRRRRGDLHRQVDRFRRRDRLARMGVPRRFDLDGDESFPTLSRRRACSRSS